MDRSQAVTMPDIREFSPYEVIDGNFSRGILLVADHAGRELPAEYGNLGLPKSEFDRHIAYDIGAEQITRHLARKLDASAVMARFSRLLIDANRGADDPTLIRQLYDGTVIRANYPMSEAEREKRLALYYRPYHEAVATLVARTASACGHAPVIVSIHSFTPVLQGQIRPWHVGVLWDNDDRVARPLIEMLAADPWLRVGDNEPYDGALKGDTMYKHAILRGYPHALIEVRQDLISDAEGEAAWADRLAPIIDVIAANADICEAKRFGSRTGPLPDIDI